MNMNRLENEECREKEETKHLTLDRKTDMTTRPDEFDSSNNYPCRGAKKGQRDIERSRKKERNSKNLRPEKDKQTQSQRVILR
jgi:hypothetical protein